MPLAIDPPFAGRPPDVVHEPTGIRSWWTNPPGIVAQLPESKFVDRAVSGYLTNELFPALLQRFPRAPRVISVQDWRGLVDYDSEVRLELIEWCTTNRRKFERVVIVKPAVGPVLDMVLSVTATTLRLAGMPFEIAESLPEVVNRLRLQPD